MSATLYLILATAVVWLLVLWRRSTARQKLDLPFLDFEGDNSQARFASEAGSLLAKGYALYTKHDQAFSIRNPSNGQRPLVILPFKYLDEVKNAPQTEFSLPLYINKANGIETKGGPFITEEVQHAARHDLNRALNTLIAPLQESCERAFAKEMPPCQDWTAVRAHQFIRKLFSLITVRVLVGPEMDLDSWLALSTQYIDASTKSIASVKAKYPPRLQWLSRYLNADAKKVLVYRQQGAELLRPILEKRIAEYEADPEGTAGKHEDAVQWLLEEYRAKGKTLTPIELCLGVFVLMFAAIHSTASTALWILFDLLDHPESLKEIREEILRVKKSYPTWTRQGLGELEVLDSFMRESFRTHSFTQLTVQRLVVQGHRFKDGFFLPAGTLVSYPSYQYSLDGDVHANPQVFDAKRHLNKRHSQDPSKFHFASTSDDTLNWGAGSHACPGRFLAREIIKLIYVQLITNYEMMYPDEGTKRPKPDMPRNFMIMPDVTAEVLFKKATF